MGDKIEQDDWGSWAQADAWRKQSFRARTPAQRLQWLKAALVLAYDSGALETPSVSRSENKEDGFETSSS